MPARRMLQQLFGSGAREEPPTRSADEIEMWLSDRVATIRAIPVTEIDPREEFANLGLDSRTAIAIAGELEEWLGREVPPTLVWDYPNIESAASFLARAETADGTAFVLPAAER